MKYIIKKVAVIGVMASVGFGTIIFFAKEYSESYSIPKIENQFMTAINKQTKELAEADTEVLYQTITKKILFQHKEGKLSDEEKAKAFDDFAKTYLPIYKAKVEELFSKCNISGLDFWKRRGFELEGYAPNSGISEEIKEINTNIKKITDASHFINNLEYENIADTNSKISKANTLKGTYPIEKCTHLVQKLNEVPSRLRKLHYNYIERLIRENDLVVAVKSINDYESKYGNEPNLWKQIAAKEYSILVFKISKLENYRDYTEEQYSNMVEDVISSIKNYKNKYGENSDLNYWIDKANYWISQARDFYSY